MLLELLRQRDLRELRAFIRGRRASITAELDAEIATPAGLREPPCLEELGTFAGTADTTWGTGGDDAFGAGGGDLAGTIDGVALDVIAVGSTAGWVDDERARARIVVVAALASGDAEMFVFDVNPTRFRAGATVPIDWIDASGLVYHYSGATMDLVQVGLAAGGTLRLAEIATTPGAPIRVSFSGPIVRSPF